MVIDEPDYYFSGARSMKRVLPLNAFKLKLIAIGAMLIDHIAFAFINDSSLASGRIMHFIGRLTAPIMCFFIAEGYKHTRSIWRYFGRLLIFALISQIPYSLFLTGNIFALNFNVLYTLALGLLAIYVYDNVEYVPTRVLFIGGIMFLSLFGDWFFIGVSLCLLFHIFRDDFKKQFLGMVLLTVLTIFFADDGGMGGSIFSSYHWGILMTLPLLYLYNGEKGGGKYGRWLFYIFYPAHLLAIWLVQ